MRLWSCGLMTPGPAGCASLNHVPSQKVLEPQMGLEPVHHSCMTLMKVLHCSASLHPQS